MADPTIPNKGRGPKKALLGKFPNDPLISSWTLPYIWRNLFRIFSSKVQLPSKSPLNVNLCCLQNNTIWLDNFLHTVLNIIRFEQGDKQYIWRKISTHWHGKIAAECLTIIDLVQRPAQHCWENGNVHTHSNHILFVRFIRSANSAEKLPIPWHSFCTCMYHLSFLHNQFKIRTLFGGYLNI